MVDFFEVIRRALNGPYYAEDDFIMRLLVPQLRDVVKGYDISHDPHNPVPDDDRLADAVFQAGKDLFTRVGVFCPDTSRVIRFSDEEVEEALRDAPSAAVYGEGRDETVWVARRPESHVRPFCFLGSGGGVVTTDDVYVRLVEGYGRNPRTNAITCPCITQINGMRVQAGSPLELLACIRSVELGRAALRRAQRPGLPILNSISTAVTAAGKITGSAFGLRDSDGWSIGPTSPLKVPFERLNEVAYVLARGGSIVSDPGPILGGYAGGPAGVAVINVAYLILSILVLRCHTYNTYPIDVRYGCNTSREIMWPISISTQAICRNSHVPMCNHTYVAAGPMTEMCLYEIAVAMLRNVPSGGAIEYGGTAKATKPDHLTPLEPLFASEVAYAATGMSRVEANEFVKRLLPRYEERLAKPPLGKRFQEAYHWDSIEPRQEYLDLYKRVKDELADLGLAFR